MIRYSQLDDMEYATQGIRDDALIMERLSLSPRIMNIYGHCGTANYTYTVKLELALQMAESIAEIVSMVTEI